MQVIVVPPPQRDDPAAAAQDKVKGDAAYRAGLYEVRQIAVATDFNSSVLAKTWQQD
jgi:hypothetical protein